MTTVRSVQYVSTRCKLSKDLGYINFKPYLTEMRIVEQIRVDSLNGLIRDRGQNDDGQNARSGQCDGREGVAPELAHFHVFFVDQRLHVLERETTENCQKRHEGARLIYGRVPVPGPRCKSVGIRRGKVSSPRRIC